MTATEEKGPRPLPQSRRRYEAVVEGILEMVEAQELQPMQALPTERELAAVFGVSRNVLRQAFGVLEERGLLRTVRGSGRYLREATEGGSSSRASVEVASIADVLEARTLIEVEVARLACDRRTNDQARQLTEMARTLTSWEDNLEFHCAVAAASQNFVLERLVRDQAVLSGELHQRDHYSDTDHLNEMRREHQAIAAAIAVRDVETATRLTRSHLERTKRVVLAAALGAETEGHDAGD